jgi:hypothetical protein
VGHLLHLLCIRPVFLADIDVRQAATSGLKRVWEKIRESWSKQIQPLVRFRKRSTNTKSPRKTWTAKSGRHWRDRGIGQP